MIEYECQFHGTEWIEQNEQEREVVAERKTLLEFTLVESCICGLRQGGGVTRHLFGYINGSPTTWWCLRSYSNTHTFLIPFYVSTPTLLSALLLSISIVIYSCGYYLTSLGLLPQVPFATYRHGNHLAYPALHFRCLQTWSEEWRTAIFIEHKH